MIRRLLLLPAFLYPFMLFAEEPGSLSFMNSKIAFLSQTLAGVSVLILLCVCATKLSSWIKMPCLLVFLGVGMLAGEEGIGGIRFDNAIEANFIGSIALAFILFSGGFDTNWEQAKKVAVRGGLLSSLGVLLTALFSGTISYFIFLKLLPESNVSLSWCILLGSIISSTDAAAVFSILRSRSVSLRGKLQSLLEFESGSNDPMAAFLTVFMVGIVLLEEQTGIPSGAGLGKIIALSFIPKMLIGTLLGVFFGKAAVYLFNKIDLEYDGLYFVIGCGIVLLSFSGAELMGGNGYMSVYVAGLVMGNSKFIYHNSVGRFSDGIAWIAQIILFSMLGLLVTPSLLWKYCWIGLLFAGALMLVARPLAVFFCMAGSKYNWSERCLVSWVGLRGGAPIMLATYPLMANLQNSTLLFHVVFFIVITSVLFQGMTIMPMAKKLGLDMPLKIRPRVPLEFDNTGTMNGETREFEIFAESHLTGKTLAELGLPREALVLLIRRGGGFVIPHGDTQILANDSLMVLGTEKVLNTSAQVLGFSETEV